MSALTRLKRAQTEGFTLLELMIAVIIVAVLAAVAIIAYTRHLRSSRLVNERTFLATIQARQETYFQRWGQYCDASGGGANSEGTPYPALLGPDQEPVAKDWKPGPTEDDMPGFMELGAHPESRVTYFQWQVEASNPDETNDPPDPTLHHKLYGGADTKYGVAPQPTAAGSTVHPWYFAVGEGDMQGNGKPYTTMYVSSGRSQIVTNNEGE